MKKNNRTKNITSQRPQKQVWRYLRTFLDEPTTIRRIKKGIAVPFNYNS